LPGVVPATQTGANSSTVEFALVSTRGIHVNNPFPTTMRKTPNLIVYNPVNNNNQIRDESTGSDCSATATDVNNTAKVYAVIATVPGGAASGDIMNFHLTADARLGIVN
jgi:hypothetical protein